MFPARKSAAAPVTCRACAQVATRQHILCPGCGAELPHIARERFFSWFQATAFCLLAVSPIAMSLMFTAFLRFAFTMRGRQRFLGEIENLPPVFLGFVGNTLIFGGAAIVLYLLVRWTAQVRNSVDSRCDRLLGMIVISLPLTILTGLSAGFAVIIAFEPWRGGRNPAEQIAWVVGIFTGFVAFVGFVAVAAQEILALRQDDRLGSAPVERVVLCPTCQAHLMDGQVICASCGTDLRDSMSTRPATVTASNPWFWMCAAIPAGNMFYWLVFLPSAMLWNGNDLAMYTAQSLPPAMLAMAFCGFQFLKGIRANYVAGVESFYARAAAARLKRKQALLREPAEPIFEDG